MPETTLIHYAIESIRTAAKDCEASGLGKTALVLRSLSLLAEQEHRANTYRLNQG